MHNSKNQMAMKKRRFEVVPVSETSRDNLTFHSSEVMQLIDGKSETQSRSPVASSFAMINEATEIPLKLANKFIQQLKSGSSINDYQRKCKSSSNSSSNVNDKTDEIDTSYSTVQSSTLDAGLNNGFLFELRSKRRELHEKAKHLSIEQRIALNRYRYRHEQSRIRAQDIFDVHFEVDDLNKVEAVDLFSEDSQEKIRNSIFSELDRQRTKAYTKQYRQLVFGRILLFLFTILMLFMSVVLIYVVTDLFQRANDVDTQVPGYEFVPMIFDKKLDD